MKVKDLINTLQSLNQERDIYVLYDMIAFNEPIVREVEDDELRDDVPSGSYVIEAW